MKLDKLVETMTKEEKAKFLSERIKLINELNKKRKGELAEEKGMSRVTFDRMLKKYGISKNDYTPPKIKTTRDSKLKNLTPEELKQVKSSYSKKSYDKRKKQGINSIICFLKKDQAKWFNDKCKELGISHDEFFDKVKDAYNQVESTKKAVKK